MKFRNRLHVAVKFALIHLGLSVLSGLIVAALVFGLWFPYPHRDIAGGLSLFWILVTVDLICGPLLTAFIFDQKKSRRELTFDLSLIGLLQVAALIYGLYSISLARPVALVFENDRMVVVSAAQILAEDSNLSWTGPVLMGTRNPKDGQETLQSIQMSLQGIEPSARPGWWQDYAISVPVVQKKMKPLHGLRDGLPSGQQRTLDSAVRKTKLAVDQLYYLPLVAGKNLDGWIALFDRSSKLVGFAPLGGFD